MKSTFKISAATLEPSSGEMSVELHHVVPKNSTNLDETLERHGLSREFFFAGATILIHCKATSDPIFEQFKELGRELYVTIEDVPKED